MSLKIGIDIDGVLAKFVDTYGLMFLRELGHAIPRETDKYPTRWDFDRERLQNEGYAEDQIDDMIGRVWNNITKQGSSFWSMLEAYPGTEDALYRLSKRIAYGDDIYFITHRPGYMAKWMSEMWLTVHGAKNPTVLMAHGNKGLIAAGLKLDVFVDDKPENNRDVMMATEPGNTRVYLIDRPWNRSVGDDQGRRVGSLDEVLDLEFPEAWEEAA